MVVGLATGAIATLIIPVNAAVFFTGLAEEDLGFVTFITLGVLQTILGLVSAVFAVLHWRATRKAKQSTPLPILGAVFATLVGCGGPVGVILGVLALIAAAAAAGLGGAWGRPLRIRGRILHPSLRGGSDWTRGERPDVTGLDLPTRRALEALWLHDAQKEHASVPAFSRISWLLAAVGAPAELLEGAHRAAMQEIDHTRRCFALAAGYGGRSHSVEAMPDLLLGGLDLDGEPHVHLAVESLKDGCLLEDFNADVAGECATRCQDPATRDVLVRITREEREHAEFSWDLLEWLVERRPKKVVPAIEKALEELATVPRPTAANADKQRLVDAADPAKLEAHGRIPDAEWARMWEQRLEATLRRARALLPRAEAA